MSVDARTRSEVEKKAKLFEAAKERISSRIDSNITIAIQKLEAARKDLLKEVEIEFGTNPFADFLTRDSHTEEEVKGIMAQEVPNSFGPSADSFAALLGDIESIQAWHNEVYPNSFDMIPKGLKFVGASSDMVTIAWDPIKHSGCYYEVEIASSSGEAVYHTVEPKYSFTGLEATTEYSTRVRAIVPNKTGQECIWSDPLDVETGADFSECAWKKCPDAINTYRTYKVSGEDDRIATKLNYGREFATIIGDTQIPLGTVTSWVVRVVHTDESFGGGGGSLFIGVAPFDIDQDVDRNHEICGWYYGCYRSALFSGPPHKCNAKPIGPRKGDGRYVRCGSLIGVTMDTVKGELSFSLDKEDLGVGFTGIPLDKPLVPCVITPNSGDSVMIIP